MRSACTKKRFTEDAATQALKRNREDEARGWGDPNRRETSVYECRACGSGVWHLTSKKESRE